MNAMCYYEILGILMAVSATKFDADYCRNELKCITPGNGTVEHLLCKYKHESSKGECTNIRGRMTPEERMHILAYHNLHRNELGMDPTWVKYPPNRADQIYARREPDGWLTGFTGALCIRQISWAYDLEKAAQIWAEQCAGDNERYNCITDFKEGFPQFMSVYTAEGTLDGEAAMFAAFDHWRATNLTMAGDRTQPAPDTYTSTVYDENNLADFRFNDDTPFLPWASMSYWRTFLLGCGKAHFRQGGADKTRIVCVYGPGINYIDVLRERRVQQGTVLYVSPDNSSYRQCVVGLTEPGNYGTFEAHYPSCPFFYICTCRGANIEAPDGNGEIHPVHYNRSSWPWLCNNDCQSEDYHPRPIPDVMDYITGAGPSLSHTVPELVASFALYMHQLKAGIYL